MARALTIAEVISRISVSESGCWRYPVASENNGYVRVKISGRRVMSHRLTWEFFFGLPPEALEPDHLCRNKTCCNPSHIEWVTHEENCVRRPRRTHCFRGHPFSHQFDNPQASDGVGYICEICSPKKTGLSTARRINALRIVA